MEEYKIGEVFQFGKIKLKCVEGDDNKCTGCIFCELDVCVCSELVPFLGECINTERKDKTGVIFIEVEETDKQEGRIEMKQTVEEAAKIQDDFGEWIVKKLKQEI